MSDMVTGMTPLAQYESDLRERGFQSDPAQRAAVTALTTVHAALVTRYQRAQTVRGPARLRESKRQKTPAQGLYMWGGVGRGKTWLMDMFFDTLPFRRKLRVHFHHFMQQVHKELKALQGVRDPLKVVAARIHDQAVVICFDEFFVTDIGDAMILGGLFEALFAHGVTLVTTSNIAPDRLYENGLQRQRFLPTIAMVKQYCDVLNVDAGTDYRLRVLERAALYHAPWDEAAELAMRTAFRELTVGQHVQQAPVMINDRALAVLSCSEEVLWCAFSELCEQPRSVHDYIELAREYHTVLLSGVPLMGNHNDDAARRFINLVDEFYDRCVKLIVSAEVGILSLYGQGRLGFEFQRTQSRLQEMQSHDYLARAHRA